MEQGRKGQIAIGLCKMLAEETYSFAAFKGTEPSYSHFEEMCIERSELQTFGSPAEMKALGIAVHLDEVRKAEIAYAVILFELGFNGLDLRGRIGQVADHLDVTEVELNAFLTAARIDFARKATVNA